MTKPKAISIAVGVVGVALASSTQAKPVYVECTLDNSSGEARPWRITLDEEAGAADVTIGDLEPMRVPATYYANSVRFYIGSGHMRMDLSRTDLTISRYSNGEGSAPNKAVCKLAKPAKKAF